MSFIILFTMHINYRLFILLFQIYRLPVQPFEYRISSCTKFGWSNYFCKITGFPTFAEQQWTFFASYGKTELFIQCLAHGWRLATGKGLTVYDICTYIISTGIYANQKRSKHDLKYIRFCYLCKFQLSKVDTELDFLSQKLVTLNSNS